MDQLLNAVEKRISEEDVVDGTAAIRSVEINAVATTTDKQVSEPDVEFSCSAQEAADPEVEEMQVDCRIDCLVEPFPAYGDEEETSDVWKNSSAIANENTFQQEYNDTSQTGLPEVMIIKEICPGVYEFEDFAFKLIKEQYVCLTCGQAFHGTQAGLSCMVQHLRLIHLMGT